MAFLPLEQTPLQDVPFAVLDLETTGLDASSDRVVQVGIVHCQGSKPPVVAINSLINPQRTIDPRASAIHGIRDQDVLKAPVFGDHAGQLLSALEGRVLAIYNAQFDLGFLRAELTRSRVAFAAQSVCVMQLRRMIFPQRRYRLLDACADMGIQLANAHNAAADAKAAAFLLQRFLDRLREQNIYTLDRLREYWPSAFLPRSGTAIRSFTIKPMVRTAQHQAQDQFSELERECERLNVEATASLERLENLLVAGLKNDVRIRWEALKTPVAFDGAVPVQPVLTLPQRPDLSLKPDPSQMPSLKDPEYAVEANLVYTFMPWLKKKREQELEDQLNADLASYRQRVTRWNQLVATYKVGVEQANQNYENDKQEYLEVRRKYQQDRSAFLQKATAYNARIEHEKAAYEKGEPGSVVSTMIRVLMNSAMPPECPDTVDIEFSPASRSLTVLRALPAFDAMPTVKSYRVIKKDGEIKEQPLSDTARKRLYDGVLYRLALRTVHEILKGDVASHVNAVHLRCYVDGFDPATGRPGRLILGRLHVEREAFSNIHLDHVDPEVCYKNLGGITNGRPSNLKPLEVTLN